MGMSETPHRMEQIAAQIAVDLADADAEDILRWAVATFGERQVCEWYQAAWAWYRRRDSYNSGIAPWRRQPPVPEVRSPRG